MTKKPSPTDEPSVDPTNQSQTDIHVETHTESHVSSGAGSVNADDRAEELTADLQRLQAEFANYRRRAEAERADVVDFAKNRIVREFLAVRDSFDRELANRPTDINPAWAASIDVIRTQFDQILKGLGVERFDSKGQPFDPHIHEAIAVEDGEGTHEVVAEELQPGYKLGSSILRHAIVKVGKTTEEPSVSPASTADAADPDPQTADSSEVADGQVK